MTERQKYYHLMGEVCEWLGPDAPDKAVRAGHPTTANMLAQVRLGRRPILNELCAMIKVYKPDYQIPEHLLPLEQQVA